jgi:hypothetical protein
MTDVHVDLQLRPDGSVAVVTTRIGHGQQFVVELPREPLRPSPQITPGAIGQQPRVRHSRNGIAQRPAMSMTH